MPIRGKPASGDALPRELKLVEAGNNHRSPAHGNPAHTQDSIRDNIILTTNNTNNMNRYRPCDI